MALARQLGLLRIQRMSLSARKSIKIKILGAARDQIIKPKKSAGYWPNTVPVRP